MKVCSGCHIRKGDGEFNSDRTKSDGLASRCRVCANAASHDWYVKNRDIARAQIDEWGKNNRDRILKSKAKWRKYNKEQRRWSEIRRCYGLSPEGYKSILESQNFRCPIGGHPFNGNICVDHDHKTGRVRGLLCKGHNTAIGNLGDDIEGVRAALEYLETAANKEQVDLAKKAEQGAKMEKKGDK